MTATEIIDEAKRGLIMEIANMVLELHNDKHSGNEDDAYTNGEEDGWECADVTITEFDKYTDTYCETEHSVVSIMRDCEDSITIGLDDDTEVDGERLTIEDLAEIAMMLEDITFDL